MRTIKRGDVGADVSTWQQIVQIHADGLFGEATDKATRAWQTAHQLLPDGKVGPRTWEAAGVTPLPNPDPRPRWPAAAPRWARWTAALFRPLFSLLKSVIKTSSRPIPD